MDITNRTYYETVYFYSKDPASLTVLFSIIIGLGGFAVVSNLMFLITVIGEPTLRRTKLSVYLIDMAIIDIISSIGYIGYASVKIKDLNRKSDNWLSTFLDAFFMGFVLLIRNSFQLLSSFLIICVAWERYKAVCRPFEQRTSSPNRKRHTVIVVIGTIVLFLLFVSMCILLQITSYPVTLSYTFDCEEDILDGIRYCYRVWEWVFHGVPNMNYVLLAVDILTLAISMSVFYFIIREIKQSPALGVTDRHQTEERKLTRMAFVNNLAFVILVLLQDILILLLIVLAKSNFPWIGEFVFNIQGIWNLLNSAANPIIYNVFGTRYRRAMVKRFRPCIESERRERAAPDLRTNTATTTF